MIHIVICSLSLKFYWIPDQTYSEDSVAPWQRTGPPSRGGLVCRIAMLGTGWKVPTHRYALLNVGVVGCDFMWQTVYGHMKIIVILGTRLSSLKYCLIQKIRMSWSFVYFVNIWATYISKTFNFSVKLSKLYFQVHNIWMNLADEENKRWLLLNFNF